MTVNDNVLNTLTKKIRIITINSLDMWMNIALDAIDIFDNFQSDTCTNA